KWGHATAVWIGGKSSRVLSDGKSAAREQPLRFVQDESQSFRNNAQQPDGRVVTQIHGRWHVTNVADRDFGILKSRLVGYKASVSHVLTSPVEGNYGSSQNPIPSKHMVQLTVNFMLSEPILDVGADVVADVIFTDNYGEEHVVRGARF